MPQSRDNPVRLEGSERFHHPSAHRVGALPQDRVLDIVVLLRPHPDAHKPHDMEEWARIPDRRQLTRRGRPQAIGQGATRQDADKVAAYATEQGLQALRVQPEGVENWQGPYLQKEIGNDPWGHPYVYHFPGEHGDEPDIISYGLDGAPGGDGFNADIVSWKN